MRAQRANCWRFFFRIPPRPKPFTHCDPARTRRFIERQAAKAGSGDKECGGFSPKSLAFLAWRLGGLAFISSVSARALLDTLSSSALSTAAPCTRTIFHLTCRRSIACGCRNPSSAHSRAPLGLCLLTNVGLAGSASKNSRVGSAFHRTHGLGRVCLPFISPAAHPVLRGFLHVFVFERGHKRRRHRVGVGLIDPTPAISRQPSAASRNENDDSDDECFHSELPFGVNREAWNNNVAPSNDGGSGGSVPQLEPHFALVTRDLRG